MAWSLFIINHNKVVWLRICTTTNRRWQTNAPPLLWLAMSPTCRRHVGPTAKCRHFWPTRPCRADTKLIPTQHFCVGNGRHLPLSSFCTRVRMYAQPAKNLYIQRSLSCLQYTIEQLLTTTTHNNQHEPHRPTLHRL
jgi:hypothetical protein